MALTKNQRIPLKIESLSSDGSGVGHFEGQAVFVPYTAPGDEITAHVVKPMKGYAFAIAESVQKQGTGRIPVDCPVFFRCGGCDFRHLSYETELAAKERFVKDAFRRIGGINAPVLPIIASPLQQRYRNKAVYPVQKMDGRIRTGFYAERSHRLIPCDDCLLQPAEMNHIAHTFVRLMERLGIEAYDENTEQGLVRHLFLRRSETTGEIMVAVVSALPSLPKEKELVAHLTASHPEISGILLNHNPRKGNVILGDKYRLLWGKDTIADTLCDLPVEVSAPSFYQVNRQGAQQLYAAAKLAAGLTGNEMVLDLYCGTGTIGLSMAADCEEVIGVEVVPGAVEMAKQNAARANIENAWFLCGDAGEAAARLAAQGLAPDVVVLDPPRKGSDQQTLDAVLDMSPARIVMVSCNPATAARDCKYLSEKGYKAQQIQPVDMFPRTKHVETVVLMSKADK